MCILTYIWQVYSNLILVAGVKANRPGYGPSTMHPKKC